MHAHTPPVFLSGTHTHTWHQISFTNFKHRPPYACTVCGKGLFSAQPGVLWQVLRGGRRVNIGGWMRQSAAFTYRWGEESDLASFHGSLHLQKLDWKQYSERCGISRCVWVCVSVFKSKSQLSRGRRLQKAPRDSIISNSKSTSIYPSKSIKISRDVLSHQSKSKWEILFLASRLTYEGHKLTLISFIFWIVGI